MSIALQPADQIIFARDCEATQIPIGTKLTVPAGTNATVTQTLGGNITLSIPTLGLLVQVAARDASALAHEGEDSTQTSAQSPQPKAQSAKPAGPVNENLIWETLKTCYDPEIPVNIVDLGLVYDMKISPLPSGSNRVEVKMTLTARGCGMGPSIAGDAQNKLMDLPGIEAAHVELVWDPPWNPEMISDEGKRRLGIG